MPVRLPRGKSVTQKGLNDNSTLQFVFIYKTTIKFGRQWGNNFKILQKITASQVFYFQINIIQQGAHKQN